MTNEELMNAAQKVMAKYPDKVSEEGQWKFLIGFLMLIALSAPSMEEKEFKEYFLDQLEKYLQNM